MDVQQRRKVHESQKIMQQMSGNCEIWERNVENYGRIGKKGTDSLEEQ